MMKGLIAFISFIILFGCKDSDIPEDVLPPEKIEPILWDLIRADQVLSIQYSTDTTVNRTLKTKEMYQQVLALHKVTEAHFKKSFRYYQSHPVALKPVLDSLRNAPSDHIIPSVKAAQ